MGMCLGSHLPSASLRKTLVGFLLHSLLLSILLHSPLLLIQPLSFMTVDFLVDVMDYTMSRM